MIFQFRLCVSEVMIDKCMLMFEIIKTSSNIRHFIIKDRYDYIYITSINKQFHHSLKFSTVQCTGKSRYTWSRCGNHNENMYAAKEIFYI